MTKDFLHSKFMMLCIGAMLIFLYPVMIFPKGELELLINQYHLPGLDIFFRYITHLGNGIVLAIFLIFLLFHNYYFAIVTTFSILLQSIFISIFKRWIFNGLDRPLAFFPEGIDLNFVEGVEIHTSNTFPSGHTATGFALFALLFIAINNRGTIVSTLLFYFAFLVGFSRIYLLQHFVIDVYFGALFGILSVVLALSLMPVIFKSARMETFRKNSLRNLVRKNNR